MSAGLRDGYRCNVACTGMDSVAASTVVIARLDRATQYSRDVGD
jgi:hypothetical protein